MRKVLSSKKHTYQEPPGRFRHFFTLMGGAIVIALFFVFAVTSQSHAMIFGSAGDGISGSFDVTLSYSSMFRVEDQSDSSALMTEERNFDDGNRNFDTGVVSNLFKAIGEFGIQNDTPSTTLGFFTRGFALYDTEIEGRGSDHDSPVKNNSGSLYNGNLSPNDDGFTDKCEGHLGANAEIRDAFLYANLFQDTEHPLAIKLGWQVINWGENLFIQTGILNAINPADVTRSSLPGTEIKEILLPTNAVSVNLALTPNISISGYYQFEHQRIIAPPPGSYFSSRDFIGDGAEKIQVDPFDPVMVATLERSSDVDDEDGQFGIALTWLCEALNDTEFGFYYLNYHAKLPSLSFTLSLDGEAENGFPGGPGALTDSSFFTHNYFTDIKLFGFSFNTTLPTLGIFETALSGEVTYREDAPVQVRPYDQALFGLLMGFMMGQHGLGTTVQLSEPNELITAQVTFNEKILAPWLADDITLLAEFGIVHTPNNDSGVDVWSGKAPADDFAWGYKTKLMMTYFEALGSISPFLSGTDVTATIAWSHDVNGLSAIPAGSFTDGARSLGLTLEALWQSRISVAVSYNSFFWDDNETGLGDRDNVAFVFKMFF